MILTGSIVNGVAIVVGAFIGMLGGKLLTERMKTAVISALALITIGIAMGITNTEFAPYRNVTRAQFVTFLWRYMGKPAAEAAAEFSDVPAGEYYADAVAWAVEAGVTNGYNDGTFKPANDCTRAQAVTFLMRAIAE